MTVRLTPSESESSPPTPVAAPLDQSERRATAEGPVPSTSDPGSGRPVDRGEYRSDPTATDPEATGTPDDGPVVAEPGAAGPVVTALAGLDAGTSGAVGGDTAPDPTGAVGADSRIALREARRVRRRTAWLCAAVVALALALTIVVVSLARTRPIPQSSGPFVPSASAQLLVPSVPTPGATAPEGGTP